jgi:hypothetical protein
MDNEQEKLEQENPAPETEPEENVVSVWYGSGNTKWFRRRHFEGYTQYETLEPDGRRVMHHVYTGYYYTQELDKRGRNIHRLAYTLLALAAGALLLLGSTRPVAANIHWPGGVPAFAGLFGLAWVLYGVINDLLVPQKRTIGDYRASSLSVLRGALVGAIASAVLVLVTVGYAIVLKTDVGLHMLAAGVELVAGALALVIWRLEKNVKYTQSRSELAGKYTM